jgi:serine/threonine-protein kinase
MDLIGVSKSLEKDCIELRWGRRWISIVKPRILQFESFPGFPSLSYFRLETQELKPWTEDLNPGKYLHEELAEIFPMEYRERWVLDAGYYGHDENGVEIPIPEDTRTATRYFGGSFVIFAKGSAYNSLKGKYDAYNAQHNQVDAQGFRDFISDLIREVASKEIELEPDRR